VLQVCRPTAEGQVTPADNGIWIPVPLLPELKRLVQRLEEHLVEQGLSEEFETLEQLHAERGPVFAHPSEAEFARLLDFYQIRWQYEPRTFPVQWDAQGRVLESFTPDFYLPEPNLYIELTTRKQSLVTKKNRKIRLLKQQYPGPDFPGGDQCQGAGAGSADCAGLPGPGTGAHQHFEGGGRVSDRSHACHPSPADAGLYGHLELRRQGASGVVRIVKDLDQDITGRHVLVVEDIVDTGLTLGYLLRILQARNPLSLQVCTLLDRLVRRIVDLPIAFRSFEIPDCFVVGYGLDYQQRYRNLPFIGVLKPEVLENGRALDPPRAACGRCHGQVASAAVSLQ
jgi:hypoxanthine phosphoribosyltransferase